MLLARLFRMLTLAFRDNAKIAAVNKAKSFASPIRRRVTFGTVLIYCLLFYGLVGRSCLFTLDRYVWRVQMALVVATVILGLLFTVWKRSQRGTCHDNRELPLQVKACLAGLLFVGILSCVAQENWLGNFAFLLVFAGMVYLLCVSGADLVRGISRERYIDIALVPLGFMAVGSVASFMLGSSWSRSQAISQLRFNGLYCDAIVAGQMFGLTCLLLFWSILHTRSKKVWAYWALFSIAILCLVLTRTRTDMLGTPIGMIMCLYAAMRSGAAAIPRRRARAILGLLLLSLVISSIWLTQPGIDTGRAKEYLRVTGDLEDILQDRTEYWKPGVRNLSITNIFGKGPLAKFGGEISTQSSTYVPQLNMHNAFLSVFQSYGWPGGMLFIILLLLVGGTLLKRKDPYATLGLSLLAFGLVQCLSENWLLSFGTPLDAYSWFILGLTLTHNSSNRRFEIADNGCKI